MVQTTGRTSPWLRQGIAFENPQNAEQALEQANLNWQVNLEKLYRKNEFGETIEVPRFRGITREDTGKMLGLATPAYVPLQNDKAFEIFNPLIDNGFAEFAMGGQRNGGRDVWVGVKLNITDARVTDSFRDEVKPFTFVINSHSGTSSVRLVNIPERIWCTNQLPGLLARNSAKAQVRLVHGKAVEANLTSAARELWRDLVDEYVELAEAFTKLRATFLDEAMFRELVLKQAAPIPSSKTSYSSEKSFERAVEKAKERQAEITKLWDGGTRHTGDHSAWEALNAYTEWYDHVRQSKGDYAGAVLDGSTPHRGIVKALLAVNA